MPSHDVYIEDLGGASKELLFGVGSPSGRHLLEKAGTTTEQGWELPGSSPPAKELGNMLGSVSVRGISASGRKSVCGGRWLCLIECR